MKVYWRAKKEGKHERTSQLNVRLDATKSQREKARRLTPSWYHKLAKFWVPIECIILMNLAQKAASSRERSTRG